MTKILLFAAGIIALIIGLTPQETLKEFWDMLRGK
jgi:hypothetical protein